MVSNVAILTGLNRKEVKKLNELDANQASTNTKQYNRSVRVIGGWINDPDYLRPGGVPIRGSIALWFGGKSGWRRKRTQGWWRRTTHQGQNGPEREELHDARAPGSRRGCVTVIHSELYSLITQNVYCINSFRLKFIRWWTPYIRNKNSRKAYCYANSNPSCTNIII